MSTVFTASNRSFQAAPPVAFTPNQNGVVVPAGFTKWVLSIDQSNVPAGSSYGFTVQYQRDAWTDSNGDVHPAGEWLDDAGGTLSGGPVTHKVLNADGSTSLVTDFINSLTSSIGAVTDGGGMVEPYPTHVRVRIDLMNAAWVFPTITLALT